jgi:uncharacterized protein (DUF2225 family)
MTEMEPVELTCPNCSTVFSSEVLMSTNTYGGQQTDFREIAAGYQPLQFLIHGCPGCGFSGFDDDFESDEGRPPHSSFPKELSKLINERLRPLTPDERTPPWRRFEHAAQISIWMDKPSEETARLFLMAAHACADAEASKEEADNRAQAIEFLRKALDKGEIQAELIPRVTYLVGELYRRIDLIDEAKKWLERAEMLAATHSDLEWLVELAKQQRTDPQEYLSPFQRAGSSESQAPLHPRFIRF